MTITPVTSYQAGSVEWLRQRIDRLGGSEIAAVLGLSPFESPFSLWHRKLGMVGPVEDSSEMEWGRRLERVIADKFFEAHPEMQRAGGGTYVNDAYPFAIATPDERALDRSTGEISIVEIKTSLYGDGWGDQGTDQIPVHYLCQVRWYMAVCDRSKAYVAVLIGGSDYREYVVHRSDDDEETLLSAGRDFIESLRRGDRPAIDGHSETLQVVRDLHPDIDGSDVDLPPDVGEEYLTAEAVARLADRNLSRLKATVLDLMGTAKYAIHADKRIAYRTARSRADGSPGTPYLQLTRDTLANVTPPKGHAA